MDKNSSERSKLLIKNIIASFVVKGWSAINVLLSVPLSLNILGIYSNGVWLTISSILIWIDLMDIGLGNGLRNAVANYIALDDDKKVREAISSTFFMLICIIIPIALLICWAIHTFDMYAALGISHQLISNLDTILIVAIIFVCCTFILKSIGNFYMGLQQPAINNLIICSGQTLALLLMVFAFLLGCRSLFVVVVINTVSPLFIWILSAFYTFKVKYPQYCPNLQHVDLKMSRSLCSTGLQFFILQICSMVLFTSTNIIISKMFSPAEVTPYQIAYRYFSIMLVVFNIICMPFWNATTDAYARDDMEWIHKTSRKLNITVAGIFFSLAIMVILSNFVYRIWIGSDVHIPTELSISMALYIFILTASLRYSYILNGINILRIQLIFTIIATFVFLPLAWIACKLCGTVTSLVYVMCIVHVPGLFANMCKYHQIFHKI